MPEATPSPIQSVQSVQNQNPVPQPKSSKTLLVVVLLIVIALLFTGIGAGGYYLLTKNKKETTTETSTKQGCTYNGQTYADSASFDATDGCNKCLCNNGSTVCTELSCNTETNEGNTSVAIPAGLQRVDFNGFIFIYPREWKMAITNTTENVDADPLDQTYLFFDPERIELYPQLYPRIIISIPQGDTRSTLLPTEQTLCNSLPTDFMGDSFTFKKYMTTCDGDWTTSNFYHYVLYDQSTDLTLHIQVRTLKTDDSFRTQVEEFVSKVTK